MQYQLLPWIDESELSWKDLSANPNAIDLLEANQDYFKNKENI